MARIITDSTADLGAEIAREFKIDVIPLAVNIGDKTYRDGLDLQPSGLFELVQQTGELPKTSAASVAEFERFFGGDEDVVYVGISSQLSATLQNARLAVQGSIDGRVRIVDSLNLSTGVGLLALLAADLRDQGLSADEIKRRVDEVRSRVRTSFIVETMEYLYKGGRCSALQAIVGSVLKIRPIIEVRPDGTMGVKEKARGTRQKGLQSMLDDFAAHLPELDKKRVFITHTGCDADAEFLRQEIARLADPQEIRITLAGSVISSHCGPDTIGILYMVK
jgi:DegV family protein with EDD domain